MLTPCSNDVVQWELLVPATGNRNNIATLEDILEDS